MANIQDPKVAGLIGSAYHALRDALVPFVEAQLRKKDNDNWVEFHQARREDGGADRLSEKDGKIAWDAYGVLRSLDIDYGYVFRRAFQDRECDSKYIQSVIVQLVSLRNSLIGHPAGLIEEAQAFLFLSQCHELFVAIKQHEYARHLEELLDQFRNVLASRVDYDDEPELAFTDDDFRIADKYTTDEVPENQRDLIIKRLSESLPERGWRLDAMERGPRAWGCTSSGVQFDASVRRAKNCIAYFR